jgi:hypothetical protein
MPSPASDPVASSGSFLRLSRFLQNFLNWDHFTIRDLRTRFLLGLPVGEWKLTNEFLPVRVMAGAEGSLVSVIDRTVQFIEKEAL